jgi:hypothetical protein
MKKHHQKCNVELTVEIFKNKKFKKNANKKHLQNLKISPILWGWEKNNH